MEHANQRKSWVDGGRVVRAPDPLDTTRNLGLLGALWFAYSTVRSMTDNTEADALANAGRLLEIQSRFGFAIEADLQAAIAWPQAFVAANAYYLIHFPITIIALVATFLRDRDRTFVTLRNSLIGVTGVSLVVHLLVPLAPPRMLYGFIDTGAMFGPDPYSIPGSDAANQFAAMPSLHVAWAILVGHALWGLYRQRGVRIFAIAHPSLTTFVVLATGHHFLADAAIGAVLALTVLALGSTLRNRTHRPGHRASSTGSAAPRSPTFTDRSSASSSS